MSEQVIRILLVGAGMFGGDVHLRTYANLQRAGISGHLGRLGLDPWSRQLAAVRFELVGIATRTETSARKCCAQFTGWTGHSPKAYWGAEPWVAALKENLQIDVVAVATPDHLHTPVILAGLQAGCHVITEKPMCLQIDEADQVLALAREKGRVVAVDMHKRYDPDHLRVKDLLSRIGDPLYASAYLEEPLEVATTTFKWADQSDPFSYVGPHWVDLFWHYFHSKPVALTAVGQKRRLRSSGINTFDAVQVRVDYRNGLSVNYTNNWITPTDFEGPVNQGHEIVGTLGKIESDQQYRGLRWWTEGGGSRTANTHFTRDIRRPDGSSACVGYGADSLVSPLVAICRTHFLGEPVEKLLGTYPNAEAGRITVAILHAARLVRDLNARYLEEGRGAPVSARFGDFGIEILDPNRAAEGTGAVVRRIYDKPV